MARGKFDLVNRAESDFDCDQKGDRNYTPGPRMTTCQCTKSSPPFNTNSPPPRNHLSPSFPVFQGKRRDLRKKSIQSRLISEYSESRFPPQIAPYYPPFSQGEKSKKYQTCLKNTFITYYRPKKSKKSSIIKGDLNKKSTKSCLITEYFIDFLGR